MRFDQHAFISYAHIDDQPLSPEQQGWVTRFHATLGALLSMRLGRPARIWRDERLHGNDVFPDEILDQFRRTALLISVLTPRYLMSDWCTRELRAFCEQAGLAGGLRLENRSRLFKVLKSPLDDDTPLPDVMKDLLGYAFFVLEDGAPLELDAAYGERFAQDYNRRVCKLAWDAAQLLKQLESAEPVAAPPAGPGRVVYLAETSHDCRPARERIEAELVCQGHTVLPDERLSCDDEDACAARIADWLARAELSIHLVGRSAGAVPDGVRGEPLVALQNRLAAERSAAHGLPRLIWLPADTHSEQPGHEAFIEALRRDAALQRGADLLDAGLDGFVQALHATLDRLARPAPAAPPAPAAVAPAPVDAADRPADAARSVYLLCVDADRMPSVALRRRLREHGVDVELPAFAGSAAAVRASNRRLMDSCDAVLVYYGAGDEAWKRGVDSELKRHPGLGGPGAAPVVWTYLAAPSSADKDDLVAVHEPNLIDGRGELPEAALAALVDALRGVRKAAP